MPPRGERGLRARGNIGSKKFAFLYRKPTFEEKVSRQKA
jgi:hypothetical protein